MCYIAFLFVIINRVYCLMMFPILLADLLRKWQKVPGEDAGLLLASAGKPHTHYHVVISLRRCSGRNAPKHLSRKTGKMPLVLYVWSIPTMLFSFCVLHMKKVAVPICVELVFAIPTALTSIGKPTQK